MKLSLVLLLLGTLLGCGTVDKILGKDNSKTQSASESCAFSDYVSLPEISDKIGSMCFVNGTAYAPDDSLGPSLDGCNSFGCEVSQKTGQASIVSSLVACSSMKPTCVYKEWLFSSCFKFKNAESQNCICTNGKIEC